MGRAERRRMERQARIQENKGKISLRPDEIRQIRRDAIDQVVQYDVEVLMTCFAMVLHEQYGFGYKRIFRALEGVDNLFGKVLDHELTIDDIRNQLEAEIGVVVQCGS